MAVILSGAKDPMDSTGFFALLRMTILFYFLALVSSTFKFANRKNPITDR